MLSWKVRNQKLYKIRGKLLLISILKEKINTNHIDKAICMIEEMGEKRLNEHLQRLKDEIERLEKKHDLLSEARDML